MQSIPEKLSIIAGAIARYTTYIQDRNENIWGEHFVPSHQLRMDGRILRGLARRGLVRLSPQNNGSHDTRYLYYWYDVSIIRQKPVTA
jgi:hypothetical protein